jgi:hypothetical protein
MGMGADGVSASNTLSRGQPYDDVTECTVLNRVLEGSTAQLPTQKAGALPGL